MTATARGLVERDDSPLGYFDLPTSCCGRPIGQCMVDPCDKRKTYWKLVAMEQPR